MTHDDTDAAGPAARSAQRHAQDRVLDAGALRALAHPLRVRIYDILSQHGPQTASSLAAALGESSGATSYHLRALAKHDLIREASGRGTARERWWERPPGGVSFANPDAMKTPAGRSATQLIMSEFFRNRNDQLLEFLRRAETLTDGWEKASLVSTASTRLTPEQTAELGGRIMALIDDAVDRYRDQTGDGVRSVTVRADLFPLPELGEDS